MKLQKSRKLQKLRRAISFNFTQFHSILPNFVQFFKNLEYVSSINFAIKFPCKKNGHKISPPRNFNQFQPIFINLFQFYPIFRNFIQFFSSIFAKYQNKPIEIAANCCKLQKLPKLPEIARNYLKLPRKN